VQGLIIGELNLTRCDIHSDRAAAEAKLDGVGGGSVSGE
jgi:hypothetical protein